MVGVLVYIIYINNITHAAARVIKEDLEGKIAVGIIPRRQN